MPAPTFCPSCGILPADSQPAERENIVLVISGTPGRPNGLSQLTDDSKNFGFAINIPDIIGKTGTTPRGAIPMIRKLTNT
jgi:hypothetical protein